MIYQYLGLVSRIFFVFETAESHAVYYLERTNNARDVTYISNYNSLQCECVSDLFGTCIDTHQGEEQGSLCLEIAGIGTWWAGKDTPAR